MRPLFARTLAFSALATVLSLACSFPAHATVYDEGRSAELRGDYDVAIERFQRSAAQDERKVTALEGLYRIYKKLRRYDDAERACNELARASGSEELKLDLGDLFRQAGRHYEAQRLYGEYLAKNPNDCHAMLGLGQCLQATGNYDSARDQFSRAGEISVECNQAARRFLSKIESAKHTTVTDVDNEIGRWPPNMMPLKVFITDGANSQGYSSEMRQHVYSAVQEWNGAGRELVRMEIVNVPERANIVVDWAPRLNGALGVARPWMNGNDERALSRVRVSLATNVDSNGKTLPPASTATSALYESRNRMMKEVTLHEFGHALGLQHSPRPDDIMSDGVFGQNSSDIPSARNLQQGDIERLTQLYSAPFVAQAKTPETVDDDEEDEAPRVTRSTPSIGSTRGAGGLDSGRKPTVQTSPADQKTAHDMQEALFQMNSGSFEACSETLTRLLARRPNDAQAHYLLAVTFVNLRRYDLATKHYQEVLKLSPQGKLSQLANSGLSKIKN